MRWIRCCVCVCARACVCVCVCVCVCAHPDLRRIECCATAKPRLDLCSCGWRVRMFRRASPVTVQGLGLGFRTHAESPDLSSDCLSTGTDSLKIPETASRGASANVYACISVAYVNVHCPCVYACMHACVRIYIHACVRARTHACWMHRSATSGEIIPALGEARSFFLPPCFMPVRPSDIIMRSSGHFRACSPALPSVLTFS